jgi:hypothetical protein
MVAFSEMRVQTTAVILRAALQINARCAIRCDLTKGFGLLPTESWLSSPSHGLFATDL